jgi:hypothetical protein
MRRRCEAVAAAVAHKACAMGRAPDAFSAQQAAGSLRRHCLPSPPTIELPRLCRLLMRLAIPAPICHPGMDGSLGRSARPCLAPHLSRWGPQTASPLSTAAPAPLGPAPWRELHVAPAAGKEHTASARRQRPGKPPLPRAACRTGTRWARCFHEAERPSTVWPTQSYVKQPSPRLGTEAPPYTITRNAYV